MATRTRTEKLTVDRKRKQAERASDRDIKIDFKHMDLRRRNAGEKNPEYFLQKYFPNRFYLPFSSGQKNHIKEIVRRMKLGEYKAIADFRSCGKTTITQGMVLWGLFYGVIHWCVWIEANVDNSKDTLDDIKTMISEPEGDDLLADDFPEYVYPVRALDNEPQRARSQTFAGEHTSIKWEADRIILPTIKLENTLKGKGALGGTIQVFGVEKNIRGRLRKGKRPDFVAINDVENEDSAKSLTQTSSIMRALTNSILGLGGAGKKLGAIMLCTIIRRGCVADQLTDRSKYPAWRGDRRRILLEYPVAVEMWDHYMYLRKKEQRTGAESCRVADRYYIRNCKQMDEGAVVANKKLFISDKAEDGKPIEYSALQYIYNLISDRGKLFFDCELQNDPPPELTNIDVVEPSRIEEKCSGVDQGLLPNWTEKITGFVDVHDQKLFWAVIAWKQGFIGHVIDYGVYRVLSPLAGTVTRKEKGKQVEVAIADALKGIKQEIFDVGWPTAGTGEMLQPNLVYVDSGYKPDAVCRFIRGVRGYAPCRGIGGRLGRYRTPKPTSGIRLIGRGYHEQWDPVRGVWTVHQDSDKWKKRTQEGFLVGGLMDEGSISLFGDEPARHKAIAEHIISEAFNSEKGKYVTVPGYPYNHWLDCMAGACCAAERIGIKLFEPKTRPRKKRQRVDVNRKTRIRTKY